MGNCDFSFVNEIETPPLIVTTKSDDSHFKDLKDIVASSPSFKQRDNISFDSQEGKVSDSNAPFLIYSRYISHYNLYYVCN